MTATAAAYPDSTTRTIITIATLAAVMMTTLDSTIAVIALPSVQSSLAASHEQIAWVLTSYLIAIAIATPISGWLADRFGRRRVMAISVIGFTASSIACGAAPNLEMLVVFRFLQGLSGASLLPLSQVLLLDINPPERHGPAMALFGMGTLLGPMIGPTLGGWLTETASWRWIFLINAPIGLVSLVGMIVMPPDHAEARATPFDIKGFLALSLALTALQLMLDRGQMLDWFQSTEICIEAAACLVCFYAFVVHIFTAPHSFVRPAIFLDRNFLLGTIMAALIGVFLVSVIPVMTMFMQQSLGYPVMLTGILSMPRAVGNIISVFIAGRLVSRLDARLIICAGSLVQILGIYMLTLMSRDSPQEALALVALIQGFGSGLLFMPLTLAVFSTLAPHYRNEGSAIFALTRNLGGAVGISLIQAFTVRDMAAVQSRLAEHVRPDNPVVAWGLPDLDPGNVPSLAAIAADLARQAAVVSYIDAFRMCFALALLMLPLSLLMKLPRAGQPAPQMALHD